ncbi:reverse transcriptase [Gossypium australe]|uniref:Reverse transcriptase n=1 Tax=Gossypium australe TaxID=47621 RepID=A0A5B6X1L7_9ROSI|nr:reverse transcriptase [Gossypium australe]
MKKNRLNTSDDEKKGKCITRKRKTPEDEIENCCEEEAHEDGTKRLKKEGKSDCQKASRLDTIKNISWNVRGLGSSRATRRLRYFLKQHNPHIVFLMETKIDKQRMEKVRRSCGFLNGIDIEAEGSRGGLCLAWKEDIIVTLRSFSNNHIDAMANEKNTNEEWRFTSFYGSPYVNNKNDFWNLLRKLGKDQSHPWLVSGDFNEIMYSFEKSGGIPREERKMAAFRETLEECQLEDIGGNFAETNIKERIDRGVANEKWKILFPTCNIHHLPLSMSDHCPLLLNTKTGNIYAGNPQFNAWWTTEKSLEKEIKAF